MSVSLPDRLVSRPVAADIPLQIAEADLGLAAALVIVHVSQSAHHAYTIIINFRLSEQQKRQLANSELLHICSVRPTKSYLVATASGPR